MENEQILYYFNRLTEVNQAELVRIGEVMCAAQANTLYELSDSKFKQKKAEKKEEKNDADSQTR